LSAAAIVQADQFLCRFFLPEEPTFFWGRTIFGIVDADSPTQRVLKSPNRDAHLDSKKRESKLSHSQSTSSTTDRA
jgi:hypothetical protein